jgi:4-amino-4-deoxy-L-arabinose transferase-like glycosyltransferase
LIWLIAIPSNLHGTITPFLARLPSAFFVWIGGIVVYLWGKQIFGDERSGLISSGILISSYLYFWQGRIARTDMVFSVIVLLSLYLFYLGYQRRSAYHTVFSFALIGLAGLTKGPVGLFLPLSVVILFLVTEQKLRLLTQRRFLLGYCMVGLFLCLWLLPFLSHVGWNKAVEVWQQTKILTRHAPFYLYGYRIWIDFAPWSLFLPSLLFYYWRKKKSQDEKFLLLWGSVLFCILTLFPVRASKYLLPAFPALALLMGGFWEKNLPPYLGCSSFARSLPGTVMN